MKKTYYLYVLANTSKMIYIGVTNNLIRRIYEHKQKLVEGFTSKYNIDKLIYYEEFFLQAKKLHARNNSRNGQGKRS